MKILMAVSSLDVGGAETHIYELIRELSSMGENILAVSSGGRTAEKLRRLGLRHLTLPLSSHNPIKLAYAYISLLKITKAEKFDIIHAHSRIAAYILSAVAVRRSLPFVTTAHAKFSLSPLKKYMTRWGYFVSSVSMDLAIYLREEYGISPERIRIIRNGVDTARFLPSHKKKKKAIAFLSRLDPDSSLGAYTLLEIAKKLSENYNGIKIMIGGGGSEYPHIRKLAAKKNREIGYDCIEVLGNISAPEDLFKEATLFVGASRAALEAMSCGLPSIICGNEGYFGIVRSENFLSASLGNFCGRDGDKLTCETLIRDLSLLLDISEVEKKSLGMTLRHLVSEHHSTRKMAEETLSFYRHAISHISTSGGDICLCGYYGFGNTGDDSLLAESIKKSRRMGYSNITALTHTPKKNRYEFGVVCKNRYSPVSVIKAIKNSRILVFGGGTLLQEGTSLRSLLYYCFICLLAERYSTRLFLWGNGIGQIHSVIGKRMTSKALKYAHQVGLRDGVSVRMAIELGVPVEKILYESDLAINTPFLFGMWKERLFHMCEINKQDKFALVCPRETSETELQKELWAECDKLKKDDYKLVSVAIYPKEDRSAAREICKKYNGKYIEGLTASELCTLLASASACISMRLHPLIFSSLANTPYRSIGNDIKLKAFCDENTSPPFDK